MQWSSWRVGLQIEKYSAKSSFSWVTVKCLLFASFLHYCNAFLIKRWTLSLGINENLIPGAQKNIVWLSKTSSISALQLTFHACLADWQRPRQNLFVRWMSGDKFHLERIIKSKILKQGSRGKERLYFCPFPSPMTAFLAVFLTLACIAGTSYYIQATRGEHFPPLLFSSQDFFLHPKKTGACYTGY